MVTIRGIMTAVTIIKSVIFTQLFLSTNTIWHSIQSIRVSPTELVTAFALVSLFNTMKLCFSSTYVQLPPQKVNKFMYIQYIRMFCWIQSQQEKIISYFHSKICNGPAINKSSRSNHRKFRKRSSGFGQWKLRKFKVKLKQLKSRKGEATIIQASMAKSKRKPKVTCDVESKSVGMDTQALKSICIDPSMMTNLRPANIKVLGIANTQTICAEKDHIFTLESTVMSQMDTHEDNNIPIVSDDEESCSSNLSRQDGNSNSFFKTNQLQTNDVVQTNTIPAASVLPKAQKESEENVSDFSPYMPSPSQQFPSDSDLEAKVLSDAAGYLRWHFMLNHLSFSNMKALSTLGIIPRKYRHMEPPVCKACQYGKQHKRPWRTKGTTAKIKPVRTPGQCISVD